MMTMGNYLDENGDFYLTKNMISTSAVLLRRLTLFDDTLKNLRSGLDKGPIIGFNFYYR